MLKFFLKSFVAILLLISSPAHAGVVFGDDDIINCGSGATLDDAEPFTFMAWVYPHSEGQIDDGRIVIKSTGNGVWGFSKNATGGRSRTLLWFKDTSSATVAFKTVDDSFNFNEWQLWTLTWDGTFSAGNDHIYVNGTEPSIRDESNGSGTIYSEAGGDFYIGNQIDQSSAFDGIIAEVMFLGKELSLGEVTNIYNSKMSGHPLNLHQSDVLGYWKLNEQAEGADVDGLTFPDYSGNGNTCTADEGTDTAETMAATAEEVLSYY